MKRPLAPCLNSNEYVYANRIAESTLSVEILFGTFTMNDPFPIDTNLKSYQLRNTWKYVPQ